MRAGAPSPVNSERMTTVSTCDFTPWREDQLVSSHFASALANSLAKLQQEIQAHHNASIEHFHDMLHLRAHVTSPDAVLVEDKSEINKGTPSKHFVRHSPRKNGGALAALPIYEEDFKETRPRISGLHPCQLVTYPSVPPAATPREEEPMCLEEQPKTQEICIEEKAKPLEICLEEQAKPLEQSTSLDDADFAPELPLSIQRWENFVFLYAFCDEALRPGRNEIVCDLWELQPCWLKQHRRKKRKLHKVYTDDARSSTEHAAGRTTRAGDHIVSSSWLQKVIVEPSSIKRLSWVLLGAIIIFYDLVMIPMGTIVDAESFTVRMISLVTLGYWLLDLPCNFIVGFLENGIVEMRPGAIAWRYAKTWLAFDIGLVAFDLLLLFTSSMLTTDVGAADAVGSARTARMGRLFRVIRAIRLLRLVKLGMMFSFLVDLMTSEYWVLCLKLFAHLFFILGANHYVACGWFSLGQEIYLGTFGHDKTSWIVQSEIENAEGYVQYLMSLHWSVTQFTPATNNINPSCALERAYAILIVLFALVMFSSFVSSVTNTVNELRRINMERTNEMGRLREFISKRQVSQDLTMRIWHFFRQNFQKRRNAVLESDIKFFCEFPESIMVDLHEEMYMPVFRTHGALNALRTVDRVMTSRICHTCFSDLFDIPKKDIFLRYAECKRVLFIANGRLLYKRPPDNTMVTLSSGPEASEHKRDFASSKASSSDFSVVNRSIRSSQSIRLTSSLSGMETEILQVTPSKSGGNDTSSSKNRNSKNRPFKSVNWSTQCQDGVWVSEAAFWVTWKHWGQLSTESHVELIVLDCKKFHDLLGETAGPLWHCLKAVAIFFSEFAEAELQRGRAVTDVNVGQELMYGFAQRGLDFQKRDQSIHMMSRMFSDDDHR